MTQIPFEGSVSLCCRLQGVLVRLHVSYSLNSLKKGYIGDYIGDSYRLLREIRGV